MDIILGLTPSHVVCYLAPRKEIKEVETLNKYKQKEVYYQCVK